MSFLTGDYSTRRSIMYVAQDLQNSISFETSLDLDPIHLRAILSSNDEPEQGDQKEQSQTFNSFFSKSSYQSYTAVANSQLTTQLRHKHDIIF